jgi:hypothetical protein
MYAQLMTLLCAATLLSGCAGNTQTGTGDSESTGEVRHISIVTITGTLYGQTYPTTSGVTHPEVAPQGDSDRAPWGNAYVRFIGYSSDGARPELGAGYTDDKGRYSITLPCVSQMGIQVTPESGLSVAGMSLSNLPFPTLSQDVNCGIAPAGDIDLFIAPNSSGAFRVLTASW